MKLRDKRLATLEANINRTGLTERQIKVILNSLDISRDIIPQIKDTVSAHIVDKLLNRVYDLRRESLALVTAPEEMSIEDLLDSLEMNPQHLKPLEREFSTKYQQLMHEIFFPDEETAIKSFMDANRGIELNINMTVTEVMR